MKYEYVTFLSLGPDTGYIISSVKSNEEGKPIGLFTTVIKTAQFWRRYFPGCFDQYET